jgi:hypothetical protein
MDWEIETRSSVPLQVRPGAPPVTTHNLGEGNKEKREIFSRYKFNF